MSLFGRFTLSQKILLGILPLFLVFISLSVALQNHFQEEAMLEQAQASAQTYAQIIKESMVNMMVNDLEVDEGFLERVRALQQFDTLHLMTNDLRLRKDLLTEELLRRRDQKRRLQLPRDDAERGVLEKGVPVFTRVPAGFRAIVPFVATEVCHKCHVVPDGYIIGAVDLHISLQRVEQAASDNWKRSLIIFVVFTLLAVSVSAVIFSRYVSRPVDDLVKATAAIGAGNLDYPVTAFPEPETTVGSKRVGDELRYLGEKFDEMRLALREKIEQLDRVNESLGERNVQLEQAFARLRQAQENLVRSERLAATGKMTAQLSHEINNPIHNIQSLLESSLRKLEANHAGQGGEKAKELICVALEEVNRMAKLTRQMLDFSRDSVVPFDKVPVDVAALLRAVTATSEEHLARARLSVKLDVRGDLPLVLGSGDKLKQVFINLLLNARDAMPAGGTVTIHARSSDRLVRVDVADTGMGIPPENIDKIFDAFFTTKKEVSGVGLGLSVSYGIVQQHNGTITVRSRVGEGTTFTIELPTIESHYVS